MLITLLQPEDGIRSIREFDAAGAVVALTDPGTMGRAVWHLLRRRSRARQKG
jgi:hypothetical protein